MWWLTDDARWDCWIRREKMFFNTRGIYRLSWDAKNKQQSLKASRLYTHWSRPIPQSDTGQNRNIYFFFISITLIGFECTQCKNLFRCMGWIRQLRSITHHCWLSKINTWLFAKDFYNAAFTVWSCAFLPVGDTEQQHFDTSWVHLHLDFIHSLAHKLKSDYPWRVLVSKEDINYL